jgi:hypothetical protein
MAGDEVRNGKPHPEGAGAAPDRFAQPATPQYGLLQERAKHWPGP